MGEKMSTAQAVISRLEKVKFEGNGTYRANSPFRPTSDSHSFVLKCTDDEHGAWMDHVSGESGSLYDLAKRLNIDTPRTSVSSTKRAYKDMSDYAAAHGVDAADMERWMWRQVTYKGRPALEYPTKTGRRWRFLDGQSPHYISEKGYKSSWYGLSKAIVDLVAEGYPLIICNGEISTITAQAHLIPAVCITAGEKNNIPDDLLDALKHEVPSASIIVALDCDETGRRCASGMVDQLRAAGFKARPVDLGLTDGGDLADFCMLHEGNAASLIHECPDLQPPAAPRVLPAPASLNYGLPPEKIIGSGGAWLMLHSDDLHYLPMVTWILKPYIPSRGLVTIYGPSGVGKSFFSLWLALQIAQNKPVLYMAYEGEYGYQSRIRAAQKHHGFKKGLTLTLGQVDLMTDDEFLNFLDSARKVKPVVIFIDTLARSMGDLNENDTRDMNTYITRCKLIERELDCCVILVHHTNKGGTAERGNGSLRNSSDVMIRLEDRDVLTLVECAKTKDGQPFSSFHIKLHIVDSMLVDEEGNAVFTPVAVPAQIGDVEKSLLSGKQQEILE